MAAKLSDAQYIAQMGLVDDGHYDSFETAPGHFMQYRGASPAEYVAFHLRRNQAARAQFLSGVRMGKLMAERDADIAAGKEVPDLAPEDKAEDLVEFAETRLDAGPEAMATLVCICTDKAGNAEMERRWLAAPCLPDFYAACKAKTEGANPDDFFVAVNDIVWDRPPRKRQPDASSNSGAAPSEAAATPTSAA